MSALICSASTEKLLGYLYGFEIELTNYLINLRSDQESDGEEVFEKTANEYKIAFRNKILKICNSCRSRSVRSHYSVTAYEITIPELDDFKIVINLDPGTIEIQTKPATLAELKKYSLELDRLIYQAGASVGLYPVYEGANHIHISVSRAFGKDVRLFRNFVVDMVNHPELASGVLDFEHSNAPPLAALEPEQIEAFRKIIEDFDRDSSRYTIKKLARRIVEEVYTSNPKKWLPYPKYQAMSFKRILKEALSYFDWTIELRFVRAPSIMSELVLFVELLEHRLNYLRKIDGFVPVRERLPKAELSPRRTAELFKEYIEEMRLSWDKYSPILLARDPTENPGMEDKKYFEKHNRANSCQILIPKMN